MPVCEWINPQGKLACVLPEYHGMPVSTWRKLMNIDLDMRAYDRGQPLDDQALLSPGMRLFFLPKDGIAFQSRRRQEARRLL